MKKTLLYILAAALVFLPLSCAQEDIPDGADVTTLRIGMTPEIGTIPAAGITDKEYAVVVARGKDLNLDWTATVDFAPDWVTLTQVVVTGTFVGTYNGDDRETSQAGIKLTVTPNTTGAKRTAIIRFTLKDGSSIPYTLVQSR